MTVSFTCPNNGKEAHAVDPEFSVEMRTSGSGYMTYEVPDEICMEVLACSACGENHDVTVRKYK